ncbi:MAG: protein-L-isoaspartate O-methyltransferase family protein [Actinomycetes bacterium]
MTPESVLAEAFRAAPREEFLPPTERRFAALDRPLPIGHGQTNSQPTTVRHLLRHLDVRPGHRVLDVGCGSGWTTALLAHLVAPDGDVVGVEIVPELVTFGRTNLERLRVTGAQVVAADPQVLGWPAAAPYDRILVSAEARAVPEALVLQLDERGVLVVPVEGRLTVVRRHGPHVEPEVRRVGRYAFVPLLEPGPPGPEQPQ